MIFGSCHFLPYDTARAMYFPPCGGRGPVGGQRAAWPPLPCDTVIAMWLPPFSALYNQISPVANGENLRCGKNILSLNVGADLFKISAHFPFGFCYNSKTHFQKIRSLLRCRRNLFGKQLQLLLQKTVQNSGIIDGMGKTFGRGTVFLFLSHNCF